MKSTSIIFLFLFPLFVLGQKFELNDFFVYQPSLQLEVDKVFNSLNDTLKVGQLIKIKPRQEGEAIDPSIYQDSIAEKASLKVGLLLPFKTNENDTIPSNELL